MNNQGITLGDNSCQSTFIIKYMDAPALPSGYVAYQFLSQNGFNDGVLDVSSTYFQYIYLYGNGGNQVSELGGQLNDYYSNPQPGIVVNDIAKIQSIFDYCLQQIGFPVGSLIYSINTDGDPIFFLSSFLEAEFLNSNFGFTWYIATANVFSQLDEKMGIGVVATNNTPINGGGGCVSVLQKIDYKCCDNKLSYTYLVEDGGGNFVPVKDIYPDFQESNLLMACEEFIIDRIEICATIDDGSCVKLFKIIKRTKNNGDVISFFYETLFGSVVSGVVVETCCNEDCACVNPTSLNRIALGYRNLFNGNDINGDKIVKGAQYFIEYLEVDGVVILNGTTLLGTTTAGFTARDDGYGLGYNKVVDLLNLNASIINADLEFVTAIDLNWGVKHNDAKDIRLVLSDLTNGFSTNWSIRINNNTSECYDGLGDARSVASWDYIDVQMPLNALNLTNFATI